MLIHMCGNLSGLIAYFPFCHCLLGAGKNWGFSNKKRSSLTTEKNPSCLFFSARKQYTLSMIRGDWLSFASIQFRVMSATPTRRSLLLAEALVPTCRRPLDAMPTRCWWPPVCMLVHGLSRLQVVAGRVPLPRRCFLLAALFAARLLCCPARCHVYSPARLVC